MILKSVNIYNFRNYSTLDLKLDDGMNIIYGDNGQGKTNILESIYVLAFTKSHRSYIDYKLIKEGENNAIIKGKLKKEISYDLEVKISKTKKDVLIDNMKPEKMANYIEKMNIIIFSSEDLYLIKGSPSERRKYINLELSQLSENYYIAINDYNKLIKIRNDMLKRMSNNEKIDNNYFNIITEYIINKSIFIYQMRNKYIEKLNNICPKIFEEISSIKEFKIKYISSLDIKNYNKENIGIELRNIFTQNLKKEIAAKMTLYGPHRDDFIFSVNNNNLRDYGSQGQQKMAVLALKLSEIDVLSEYKKTSPIILLDDVFSDLDNEKKNNLLKHIDRGVQVIITTTNLESIDKTILDKSKLIEIKNGQIVKEEVKK